MPECANSRNTYTGTKRCSDSSDTLHCISGTLSFHLDVVIDVGKPGLARRLLVQDPVGSVPDQYNWVMLATFPMVTRLQADNQLPTGWKRGIISV